LRDQDVTNFDQTARCIAYPIALLTAFGSA
jgi:hypothetical protein